MTTRRGFLGAMLAACAAPAIVRADSLMKIVVPSQELILPPDKWFTPPELEIKARPVISYFELGNESWNGSEFHYEHGSDDLGRVGPRVTGELGVMYGMRFIESPFQGTPAEFKAMVNRRARREKAKKKHRDPVQELMDRARMRIRS